MNFKLAIASLLLWAIPFASFAETKVASEKFVGIIECDVVTGVFPSKLSVKSDGTVVWGDKISLGMTFNAKLVDDDLTYYLFTSLHKGKYTYYSFGISPYGAHIAKSYTKNINGETYHLGGEGKSTTCDVNEL